MTSIRRNAARHSYRGPLQAVVFDWAGTVIDYGSLAPVLAVMAVFHDFQTPVTMDEARGPMGMAKRDHLRAILEMPRVRREWQAVYGKEFAESDALSRLYGRFLEIHAKFVLDHCDLIPGCLETIEHCRQRNLRIGSSTGYDAQLMKQLIPAARRSGLQFDEVVCADDVLQGRPAPWMCLENARRLRVFPMKAAVVIDDTTVGIEAGVNAGMWTVGVAKSGNLLGLSADELSRLPESDCQARIDSASSQLFQAGAHFVVNTVADLPAALAEIDRFLVDGASP